MKFSILIPTYNRRDVLSRTLTAAFAQDFPADEYEVIVVVDGSNDGTVEMLQELHPCCGFRFINQANHGLPFARNAAMEAAGGNFVLILDDDIVCEPDLLAKHYEQHLKEDRQVVFGPVPLHPDSPPGIMADQWTTWNQEFQDRLTREDACRPPAKFWLAAAAPAVNRSISRTLLMEIGGCCDEAMKDCHEDWDLGIRLWKAGFRFHFLPDAIAYHFYVKTDRDLVARECKLFAKGEVALSRKHPEYRPLSMLAGMWSGSCKHRLLVNAAVQLPISAEPIAHPLFRVLDRWRTNAIVKRVATLLLNYRTRLKICYEAAQEAGSSKQLKAEFGMQLPVLCYHHVGTPKPGAYPDLSVTAERFERDIRWLRNNGYHTISPSDWLRWLREGKGLPPKPVLLTFDDAYADLTSYAFPVLRRYGFQATVFVVTGHIGGTNAWDVERGSAIHPLMTADDIRFWAANGIEFGAHSKTHPNLARIPISEATEELLQSKNELAELLGSEVRIFAYPYGSCNEAVTDCARELFQLALTTREGLNDLTTDPFLLKRSCVRLHESIFDLNQLLRWGRRPLQQLRDRIRLRERLARAGVPVALYK